MKKLMVSAIAALFAVMLVIPAYAEDRLELSGQFYVRGWDVRNAGFVDDNDSSYIDQRMRIAAKINVSDDAHLMIRSDLGEAKWGQDFTGPDVARPNFGTANELHFDRLYLFLDRGMWNLTLGQQYAGLGINEVLDANITGVNLGLNFGAVNPSFIVAKIDEAGSLNDDDANDDTNLYAANLSFLLGESFDSNFFGGMIDDNATNGEEVWALGFHTQGKLGNLGLTGEIAYFDGDNGAGIDYTGTQFFLKAESAITEMFSLGGEVLYAFGTDDPTEAQRTNLYDWATFTPFSNNTPEDAWISGMGFNPFDPSNDNAGVMGLNVFGKVSASDVLSMGGKVGYFEPEEDDVTAWDSSVAFNAWVAYQLTGNTQLSLTYLHVMPDFDSTVPVDDEDEGTLVARFQINF